jgi:hypothetical protein
MSTPNLALAHIAASQTQKEVTANAAFDALDTAVTDQQSINCAGAADVTPASTIVNAMVLLLTGLLTGSINLKLPQVKRPYFVRNTTTGTFTITVKTTNGASTGVIVPQGSGCWVYSDGTNVIALSAARLKGVSAAVGGGALTLGQVATGTASIAGASAMIAAGGVVKATPNTYPGDGFVWGAYLSGADTITVVVTCITAGTPTSSTYNVSLVF